jgi:hypothetical protein
MKKILKKKPTSKAPQPAAEVTPTSATPVIAEEAVPASQGTTETDSNTATATAGTNIPANPTVVVVGATATDAEKPAVSNDTAPEPAPAETAAPTAKPEKIKPFEQEAYNWMIGREAFGGVSPSMFVPIYSAQNHGYTILGCDILAEVLGRSLTLAEAQMLVSKDGETKCKCSNPACGKEFVPVKWTRITGKLRDSLKESKDLAKTLAENQGFVSGSYYMVQSKKVPFCGSPFWISKKHGGRFELALEFRDGKIVNGTCNARMHDVNLKPVGDSGESRKLWGMPSTKIESIINQREERRKEAQEREAANNDFFQNMGELIERTHKKKFTPRRQRRG